MNNEDLASANRLVDIQTGIAEDDLNQLLAIIEIGGGGFHTYPGRDGNQDRIHARCVELERRGRVIKQGEEAGHVTWGAEQQVQRRP